MIVFDLDRVLFNSTELVEKSMMENYPSITKEMWKEFLCDNFHEVLEKIKHLKKPKTEEEIEKDKLKYSEDKSRVPMYKGAKELLQKLHEQKYILVLNTAAWNRNTLPLLERNGITNFFDSLITGEISKNKVEKFKIIKKKYKVKETEMIFVTDTLGTYAKPTRRMFQPSP